MILDPEHTNKHRQGTNYSYSNDVEGMKRLLMDEYFEPCDMMDNSYTWSIYKDSYEVFVLMVEERDIDLTRFDHYALSHSIQCGFTKIFEYTTRWYVDNDKEYDLVKILKEKGIDYKHILNNC